MPYAVFTVVAAYLIVLPNVDLLHTLEWHDNQRLAQLVLLTVVAAGALAGGIRSRSAISVTTLWRAPPAFIRTMLIAAFLLGAVSSAMAPYPRWAFLEWSTMALLMLLALSVAATRRESATRFDRLLLGALVFTAVAYTLKVGVAYSAAMLERLPLHVGWLIDGFSNPRFFGHFQGMTLPLLVLPAMYWARTLLSRVGWTLLPTFWWMLAIASGTRGTWLAMMAACAVVLLSARRAGYPWLKWQLGTFLGGFAVYILFFLVVPGWLGAPATTINRLSDITSLSHRDVIWTMALEYIAAHPFLGIGPMHFAYYPNPIAAHPHMSLLQWAAEWGLPSALLVLGVVLYAGMSFVRQLRAAVPAGDAQAYTLRLALLASLSAAAVQSLVDGVIVMPYSQTLLAVICGWAFAVYRSNLPFTHPVHRSTEVIGVAVVLLSAALLMWGVFPEVQDIAGRQEAYTNRHPERTLLPRFWGQGWIVD